VRMVSGPNCLSSHCFHIDGCEPTEWPSSKEGSSPFTRSGYNSSNDEQFTRITKERTKWHRRLRLPPQDDARSQRWHCPESKAWVSLRSLSTGGVL
jgi:hypothetical protein